MVADSRATLGAGRLRVLNRPEPVRVGNGQVLWRGQWQRVEAVLERWRVDDEWWREKPISRLYLLVLLAGGARVELFQDLLDGQWHAQT